MEFDLDRAIRNQPLQESFRIKLIRREEDKSAREVHDFFEFYFQNSKTGQAELSLFHPQRELFWQSFEPLATFRDVQRQNLGTLAYGLALTGTILTEDIYPDYKVYHDPERPLCVATLFDIMGLPSGLSVREHLDRYIAYAKTKGFSFTDPFLDKKKRA
jgi:hypothetical protein